MEIRQGLTNEGWDWLLGAILMKKNYDTEIPQEIKEVYEGMVLLQSQVESSCPAIKLTLREKEDA